MCARTKTMGQACAKVTDALGVGAFAPYLLWSWGHVA